MTSNVDNEIKNILIPKKRGRKSNNTLKKKEIKTVPQEIKKRGRKPTCKIINTIDLQNYKNNIIDECLIIHLPLTKNDINKINYIDKTDKTEKIILNIDEDLPKINSNIISNISNILNICCHTEIEQKDQNIYKTNNDEIDKSHIKPLNNLTEEYYNLMDDITNKESRRYENSNIENDLKKIDVVNNSYNMTCINCINLHKRLNIFEKINIKSNKIIHNIEIKLEDIYTGKDLLEKRDIMCWWCCHIFDTLPIGLPEKYNEQIFYVIGYFCSFNCAMSYNFSLNDYKIWERISLLYFLKQYININSDTTIIMAPPRCMLKIFGGVYTIEEFRDKSIVFKRQFRTIIFPIISVTKQIEESDYLDDQNLLLKPINGKKKFISSNDTELVLKRSKPLNKSSLYKMMNIQNINNS